MKSKPIVIAIFPLFKPSDECGHYIYFWDVVLESGNISNGGYLKVFNLKKFTILMKFQVDWIEIGMYITLEWVFLPYVQLAATKIDTFAVVPQKANGV
jgi:hypothetical protein